MAGTFFDRLANCQFMNLYARENFVLYKYDLNVTNIFSSLTKRTLSREGFQYTETFITIKFCNYY
jgi:hypothetical protein